MNLVFIEWTDASGSEDGWTFNVKLEEYSGNCYTCGILLDENDDFILVASSKTADDKSCMGAIAIPKRMIDRRVELETP